MFTPQHRPISGIRALAVSHLHRTRIAPASHMAELPSPQKRPNKSASGPFWPTMPHKKQVTLGIVSLRTRLRSHAVVLCALSWTLACQMLNPAFVETSDEESSDSSTDNTDSTDSTEGPSSDATNDSGLDSDSLADTSSTTDVDTSTTQTSSSSTTNNTTTSTTQTSSTSDTTTSETTSTVSTTATDTSSDSTSSDLDTTVPTIGDLLPLPVPFCPADKQLLSCLSFDDSDLTTAVDGSSYSHDAAATLVARRWIDTQAPYEFLKSGWETGNKSKVTVAANSDLRFSNEVRLEVWWHPLAATDFNHAPLVALNRFLQISVIPDGYSCLLTTGSGGTVGYALNAQLDGGIEYVACALKDGKLSMEAANQGVWTDEFLAGIADLSVYQPALRVMWGIGSLGVETSQTGVVYGVRVWQREQP